MLVIIVWFWVQEIENGSNVESSDEQSPGQHLHLAANFDLSQSFGFRPESSRPFSVSDGVQSHSEDMPDENMLASLEAMLIQKFDPPTESPI